MDSSPPIRFFVCHLDIEERPAPELSYEIQLLDTQGRAVKWAYVSQEMVSLTLDELTVPYAVVEAARRQKPGQGDYVDINGRSISPF